MSAERDRVIEPVSGQAADLEILDQDVGFGGERAHLRLPLGSLEVDRHRALAAVAAVEIGRGAVGGEGRSPLARIVAGPGPLDLDHFGPEIGEQLPRPGPGEDPGQLDDLQAGEGLIHHPVIPAKAGTSGRKVTAGLHETPAFAGVTVRLASATRTVKTPKSP